MNSYSGFFINLERCVERRQTLLAHLGELGCEPGLYQRFEGIEPGDNHEHRSFGLTSKGELGIWRSVIALLQSIASQPGAEVVHVVEDDARLPAGAPLAIEKIASVMTSPPEGVKKLDLIFLDYYMNKELLETCLPAVRRARSQGPSAPREIGFLPSRFYLASLTSFLVSRASAEYLASLLTRVLENSRPLPPVDLALRQLIQVGAVSCLISNPPLGAPAWESVQQSTIQTEVDAVKIKTQAACILARNFVSGVLSPEQCCQMLAELFDIEPSCDDDVVDCFNGLFHRCSTQFARI